MDFESTLEVYLDYERALLELPTFLCEPASNIHR
jgi:hypothetical protein